MSGAPTGEVNAWVTINARLDTTSKHHKAGHELKLTYPGI